MCLYPKLILNKRYLPTKKNNYCPPELKDLRLKYVTCACGECLECRKQKARAWQVRITEETKTNPNGVFPTLTIDDKSYKKLKEICKEKGIKKPNDTDIATIAIRRFMERIRKHLKHSLKHWFITELGQNKTERLHLHGVLWGIEAYEMCEKYWKYGHVFIGTYVNQKTAAYITKYMTKEDIKHPNFVPKVLCSPGIGKGYAERTGKRANKFQGKETSETYRLPNCYKLNLPIYYRNVLFSEEEREQLFLQKIEKGIS